MFLPLQTSQLKVTGSPQHCLEQLEQLGCPQEIQKGALQQNLDPQKLEVSLGWLLGMKVNLSLFYSGVCSALGENENFKASPQTKLVPDSKLFLQCKD